MATAAAGNVGVLSGTQKLGFIGPAVKAYDGVVASVIVCNAYLGAAERQNVRGYLAGKYGVAS